MVDRRSRLAHQQTRDAAGNRSKTFDQDRGRDPCTLRTAPRFLLRGGGSRYEARKQVLLDDAMAIGGLATVAGVLEEPDRSSIIREIRLYVEQRLVFGITRLDDPRMEGLLRDARAAHTRMTALVAGASRERTLLRQPALVNASTRDGAATAPVPRPRHVPGSMSSCWSCSVSSARTRWAGCTTRSIRSRGAGSDHRYAMLVGLVFFVTIDLEQPRRGLLRVSQAPMQDLRSALASTPQP